uniref:Uncharacterized protein n=1 Tax=Panagrolaimus sp. JU765 TaxID=591449 RepID=A0AC34RSI2_9BILA
GQREVISADWKPLKPSTAKFRVEIAGPEDKLLVSQYLTEGFAKHLNICAAIKMKFEDLAPVSYGWVDEMIDNNNTYCVFADDRLVSICTTILYERKDFPKVFRNGVGIPTADVDFELLPDYAEFIKSGPFNNHKANQIDAIFDVCNTYVGHQMPDHVQ